MGTKTARKRKIILVIVLALMATVILIYFRPIPVINADDVNNWEIQFLASTDEGTFELKEITKFDEEAILFYLSSCSRRRVPPKMGPIIGEKYDFVIVLHIIGPEGTALIEFNNKRCTGNFNGDEYIIQNAKTVATQLRSIIYG